MNEILLLLATKYQTFPVFTTFLAICIIWYSASIGTQLFNWAVAWIDDAKEVKVNQVHQITFVSKRGCDDDLTLYTFLIWSFAITLSVCINFWFITIWFLLLGAILYSLRGGRRVQKKLTAHIKDKDAHSMSPKDEAGRTE